jgi:hypothetical protein
MPKQKRTKADWKRRYNIQMRIEDSLHIGGTCERRRDHAVRKGNKKTIKHHGKDDVDTENKDGQTPLQIAAENKHLDIVQMRSIHQL